MDNKVGSTVAMLLAMTLVASWVHASPDARVQDDRRTFTGVRILSRSKFPPYSGYIKTWVVLRTMHDGMPVEFYYPYFDGRDRVPQLGSTCALTFHAEMVSGQAGTEMVRDRMVNLVDRAVCRGGERDTTGSSASARSHRFRRA